MIKLDDNLLAELGLATLSADDKQKMLAHIYETLEMRVGVELAKQMTEAQLKEFEEFINRNDEAGALHWLETNFPYYKDVVAAEFEKLKGEISQMAPQIISSSGQQQSATAPLSGGAPQQQSFQPPTPQYQQQPVQQPYYQQPVDQQQYSAGAAPAPAVGDNTQQQYPNAAAPFAHQPSPQQQSSGATPQQHYSAPVAPNNVYPPQQ